MAVEGEAPENLVRDHRSGYNGFVHLMAWGAGLSFVAAMVVIALIAS
jgi:hypothetical protein